MTTGLTQTVALERERIACCNLQAELYNDDRLSSKMLNL